MLDTERYAFDSGLKVLYITGPDSPRSCGGRPLFVKGIGKRCQIITPYMSSLKFSTIVRLLEEDGRSQKMESVEIKQLDYLADDLIGELICFQNVQRFVRPLYGIVHLLKRLKGEKKDIVAFVRQLQMAVKDMIDGDAYKGANELVQNEVALVLMSPCTTVTQQRRMLTCAVLMRIPLGFVSVPSFPPHLDSSQVPRNTMVWESAAHKALRRKRAVRVHHISEIYGAKFIAAAYCGLLPETTHIPGFWMHGWIPSYHNVHPAFVALHKSETVGLRLPWARDVFDPSDLQLVTRKDQESFLRSHGYVNVRTIGHPLVYLRGGDAPERVEGSLLVVPPHGGGFRGECDPLVREYVDYICSLKKQFSLIKLCVTVDDYLKRDWWPAFEKVGIHNIVSVERSDPHAWHRLRRILTSFEYVTTNSYGSIIAYAAFAGCKISVSGPYAELPQPLLKRAHAVLHFPELFQTQVALCAKSALQEHYPELFVEPKEAGERVDWGRHELGYDHRLSPDEMRAFFSPLPARPL